MKLSDGSIVEMSLRLHGDDLNPDEISGILGVLPSSGHRKGDKRTSRVTGFEQYAPWKSGVWILYSDRNPDDGEVAHVVSEFLGGLEKVNLLLGSLPGVQEAYFDIVIFGAIDREDRNNKEIFVFELGTRRLAALARFGIPIRFKISIDFDLGNHQLIESAWFAVPISSRVEAEFELGSDQLAALVGLDIPIRFAMPMLLEMRGREGRRTVILTREQDTPTGS
ncbi:MAG: DUF4279 domain-containing protein [Alphaproteobacteria bacterium]|nr:DUF4279 domain-containing protein [Alphaproteobacteria bacterium]